MRVLHAISGSDDPGALALVCGMRDAGVDCVVLAQAGSATAVRAAALSLSTIALGRGSRAGDDLGDALSLVDPDLVHVHGMHGHGGGGGLPADVVTLAEADLDDDGLPALGGGLPEDARCAVVLPAGASRDEARVRARLPRHVRTVAWASRLPVTQCAGIYVAATGLAGRAPRAAARGVAADRATP